MELIDYALLILIFLLVIELIKRSDREDFFNSITRDGIKYNVSGYYRSSSSYLNPNLDSSSAWSAGKSDTNQKITLIFPEKYVESLITQGRANYAQWVKTADIYYKENGKWVKMGRKNLNTNQNTKVYIPINKKITEIQIQPKSWQGYISMRAGIKEGTAPVVPKTTTTTSSTTGTTGSVADIIASITGSVGTMVKDLNADTTKSSQIQGQTITSASGTKPSLTDVNTGESAGDITTSGIDAAATVDGMNDLSINKSYTVHRDTTKCFNRFGKLPVLDGVDIKCPGNYVLRKLEKRNCNDLGLEDNIRLNYECIPIEGKLSEKWFKTGEANSAPLSFKDPYITDLPAIKCSDSLSLGGKSLRGFIGNVSYQHPVTRNQETGDETPNTKKIYATYKCIYPHAYSSSSSGSKKESSCFKPYKTTKRSGFITKTHYSNFKDFKLDANECSNNEAMRSFTFSRGGCSKDNAALQYYCATANSRFIEPEKTEEEKNDDAAAICFYNRYKPSGYSSKDTVGLKNYYETNKISRGLIWGCNP